MKLIDKAKILRSKNAGPLFITFDIMFETYEDYAEVLKKLKKEDISRAYDTPVESIEIIPYEVVNSIKVTFPRKHISGSVHDNDVYGCGQHIPLANIIL